MTMKTTRDGWQAGTKDTAPKHIWMHEVFCAALAKGADAEIAKDPVWGARIELWFQSGEPVWMAADGLAFGTKAARVARNSEKDSRFLKSMRRT